ncbi:hypothetical protein [Haloferax volcanii]|uniref:Uncharacterized protein n=1 Tax=Haloferax volcanii TaxID=2246 RepID=A0A847TDN6_HALVO|nr:hypothetical protein [Haloferax alexandrinus]NLV03832.1 hypothetical protein [Haloferax alexandrinus]
MPIQTDSETWSNASSEDSIKVEINNLLGGDKAYSIKEIDDHLVDEVPHLFPSSLTGSDAIEGAEAARQSIITNILEEEYWRSGASFKYVSGDGDAEEGLYYTLSGVGFSPVAELDDIKTDVDQKSGILRSRFKNTESKLGDEIAELEERLSNLEYRFHEEIGRY